jgi:hypothetical protein
MPERLKETVTKNLSFALFVRQRLRVLNECFQTIDDLRQVGVPNPAWGIPGDTRKAIFSLPGAG